MDSSIEVTQKNRKRTTITSGNATLDIYAKELNRA
jgi:hypothetical protein